MAHTIRTRPHTRRASISSAIVHFWFGRSRRKTRPLSSPPSRLGCCVPIHDQFALDEEGQPSAGGLVLVGCHLAVEIHIHPALSAHFQKQQPAQTPPTPIVGRALIDTGATFTAIDRSAASQLNLMPVDTIQSGTRWWPTNMPAIPSQVSVSWNASSESKPASRRGSRSLWAGVHSATRPGFSIAVRSYIQRPARPIHPEFLGRNTALKPTTDCCCGRDALTVSLFQRLCP